LIGLNGPVTAQRRAPAEFNSWEEFQMTVSRVALVLCAAILAVIGFMFLFFPAHFASAVHIELRNAMAVADLRAVYGGMDLGLAVFFVVCALRRWIQPGLLASALVFGGLAYGRAFGFLVGGGFEGINRVLFACEAAGLAVSVALFQLEMGRRGRAVVKSLMKGLLGSLFVLAGANHFINPAFYVHIMPYYFPARYDLVLLSGVCEIVAGLLLLTPGFSRVAAWGIVAMLVLFLTVHVHMIVHAADYAGVPPGFLYLRLVLQVPLIAWAFWFTRPDKVLSSERSQPKPTSAYE
jgi:uncharacterized membrane protein